MATKPQRKKGGRSLTSVLAVSFFSLCVVTLVISSAVQILSYLGTQQETIKGKQEIIARDAKNETSGFITAKQRLLSTAASLSNLAAADRGTQQRILSSVIAEEPFIRNIIFQNSSGEVVASASHISRSDTQRFVKLLAGDISAGMRKSYSYISDMYIEELTGEPMAVISVQLKDIYKEFQGILSAELDLTFMWDLIGTIEVGNTGKGNAYVVDRRGRLIAFRDTARVLKGENVSALKPVAEFIRTSEQTEKAEIWNYKGISGNTVMGTFLPLGSPDWAVITELPLNEAYREVIQSTIISIFTTLGMAVVAGVIGVILARRLSVPLRNLTGTATAIAGGDTVLDAEVAGSKEIESLSDAFNSMTAQLRSKAESFRIANQFLSEIVGKSKDIVLNLNSSSKEIEAAAQEQTSAANEQASGITEVSATLQELSATARQITNNVGELVLSSEETVKVLTESEKQLLDTVSQLDEAGEISRHNTSEINELGKRSILINEMVELIKEVANKTNILSINASIEASRSGEAGSGFSVVAAEIRELSKETINSAKKAEQAAKDIQDFLNSIIESSRNESTKVVQSGKTVRGIHDSMGDALTRLDKNYSFTQKINVSIKQQESGSVQAAETMRQMAEISRQSAETARQTLDAVKDIVKFAVDLEGTVNKIRPENNGKEDAKKTSQ